MSSNEIIPNMKFAEDLYFTPAEKEITYKSLNFFTEFSTLGDVRANITKSELQDKSDPQSQQSDTDTIDTEPVKTKTNDPWSRIDQGTKTSPLLLMRLLMKSRKHHDFEVFIGGEQFNCHITLLQTYSSYFWNIDQLRTTRIELDEKDISAKSFDMIYEWILNDFPDLQPSDLPHLFQGACFLGIDKLVKRCWRYLDNDLCIREFESIRMYRDGFRYFESNALRELFFSRVCKYFLPLVASEVFLSLDFIEVCVLLSSSAIGVNAESEVLMAALRWINNNPERKIFTEQLMACVRFELMPTTYLASFSSDTFCPVAKQVFHIKSINRRILLSTQFASDILSTNMTAHDLVRYEEDNFEIPRQRQWLIDPKCPYHHILTCCTVEKLTFASFEKYMETLKNSPSDYWETFQFTSFAVNGPCSNERCVSEENMTMTKWNINRQMCVHYLRYCYGEPTLKVSSKIQDFINNSYMEFRHLISNQIGKQKSLRLKGIEDIEREAFGISKERLEPISDPVLDGVGDENVRAQSEMKLAKEMLCEREQKQEADNMNKITIKLKGFGLQTHDLAGQAVSAEKERSDDEI